MNNDLLEDLFQAYFNARKNKRNKKDQIEFEQNFESNLMNIYELISSRKFKPDNYIAFINKKPVIREVFAASFRDRVIHHLLYKYLSEIYEPYFINDSFSCRVGKGTLYGVYRVKEMISTCSNEYRKDCYILKLDVAGYFYSINKNLLYKMCLQKMKKHFLKEKYNLVNFLLKSILFQDVTKNVRRVGKLEDWKLLRKDRSLFSTAKNIGLPIGNLTSQLFSNIYMNEFDHFIKNDLNIKHYGRYVDDFVVVHEDKEFLKKLIKTSRSFLKFNLALDLHPQKIYLQHYTKGIEFLGAFIKPYRVYVGNRTKKNFFQLILSINKLLENDISLAQNDLFKIRDSFNSYLGLLKWFNTFNLRYIYMQKLHIGFYKYFYVDNKLDKISISHKKDKTNKYNTN